MRVKDARQTFLGIWIKLLVEGSPFEVWGGEQLRDFTFVDDAVTAFLLAASKAESDGKIYNLGGDQVISLLETAKLLSDISGGTFAIHEYPAERKKIDIGNYYSDDRLIRSELGWKPQVMLADGLQKTMDYYQKQLAHYR